MLPPRILAGPDCTAGKIERARACFAPGNWLDDESIDLVHGNFRCLTGGEVGAEAFVVDARTSGLLAFPSFL